MQPLGLFGIAFVGTFFWVASPEAAVALFASTHRWNAIAIGAVAAAGQAVAHLVLFCFGAQLRCRWRWFDRQCARMQARYAGWLGRNVVVLALSSGLLGLPPTSATAALAPALGLRGERLLPVMFAMRIVRFTAIAALATRVHVAVTALPGG